MSFNPLDQELVQEVWRDKYRNGDEQSPLDSFKRVVDGVFANDPSEEWKARTLKSMSDFVWCPGGRIHAGAGTVKKVTLINCFVSQRIQDSMVGIMDSLTKAALTQQQGGGIGMDFSPVRPAGAVVRQTGSVSSGVLPFMDMFHSMCGAIKSSGSRRGAMMATLADWHPDVIDFITAKQTTERLTNFNVSVLITDDFMKSVEDDKLWILGFYVPLEDHNLDRVLSEDHPENPTNKKWWKKLEPQFPYPMKWYVYRVIPARELWNMIIRNTYEWAEPGVLFIDRINEINNLQYCEHIHSTNPCLTGDTLVSTGSGSARIRDVIGQPIDLVLRGKKVHSPSGFFSTGVQRVYRLETKEGLTIRATGNERFSRIYNMAGRFTCWTSLDCLIPGDVLETSTGEVIVENVIGDGREETFDAQVPGENAFEAGGFVVHNCGEQPLPPNGDCNLGAINLANCVLHPFTDSAIWDWERIREAVKVGMRFLDNVLDVSLFPTPEQKEEAQAKRRTGLGITGLGTALQEMKIRYGSEESVRTVRDVMRFIRDIAYNASVSLAIERGPFPLFHCSKFLAGKFIEKLPAATRQAINMNGIRNGVLLTIAPTGTTSIYYGNISSGIEPTFAWEIKRKKLMADNSLQEFEVEDYGWRMFKEVTGHKKGDKLPDYMVTALELTVKDHLAIQAACQEFIDSSISKTINCPKDMPFEEFEQVYEDAWKMGLKGCTTYRPSGVRGSILEAKETKSPETVLEEAEKGPETGETPQQEFARLSSLLVPSPPAVIPRPDALKGVTYKIKWPPVDQAFYVTINNLADDEPFEIFVNSKSVQHIEWVTALTRTMSAVFRKGGDPSFLVEELEQVYSPQGGAWVDGKYVPSMAAMIGRTLKRHLEETGKAKQIGQTSDPIAGAPVTSVTSVTSAAMTANGTLVDVPQDHLDCCPKCNRMAIRREEGCAKCGECGWSNCGG